MSKNVKGMKLMRNVLRRWLLAGIAASLSCPLFADTQKNVPFSPHVGNGVLVAFEGCPIKTVQFQSKGTEFNTLAFGQGVKLGLTEKSITPYFNLLVK